MEKNPSLKEAFKAGNLLLLCVYSSSDVPFVQGGTYSVLELQSFLDRKQDDTETIWELNYEGDYFYKDYDEIEDFAKENNIPLEEFDNTLEVQMWYKDNPDTYYSPVFFIYKKIKLEDELEPFEVIKDKVTLLSDDNLFNLNTLIMSEIRKRVENK